MCGITGALGHPLPTGDAIRAMTDALYLRGPDEGDVWMDADAGIALGHRRLSILDLSPAGHQPMRSACGRYAIAFNGEIYNHLDIRRELEKHDLPQSQAGRAGWRGHSDTETLLAGFSAWGVRKTLERTVGMFAIALWDRAERRLYLARDRFGEKPLYYGWAKGAFVFGSELKALRRFPGFDNQVDRNVLALYVQFCYVPSPYAIYRDIYKLEPGCLLSVSLADAGRPSERALAAPARHAGLTIERYWSAVDAFRAGLATPLRDETEAAGELEARLSEAVRIQSIADVPLGAFLSGGVDSSTIVALMQTQSSGRVKTFTIGFEEAGYNEAKEAKLVAQHLGTDHTEQYVSAQQARDVIPKLPELYAEPFADSSQVPTHLVAQMARPHVTVALSGDGGDELFGGYVRYLWGCRLWARLSRVPPVLRRSLGAVIESIPAPAWDTVGKVMPGLGGIARLGEKAHKLSRLAQAHDVDGFYRMLSTGWSAGESVVRDAQPLRTALDDTAQIEDVTIAQHRMMVWDAVTYLPDDVLHKVDRAAMGVSLETRAPFLDHRVAEFAWRLPLDMKIRHGQGKWIVRQQLYKHVPRELIERAKMGFAIPIDLWLRGPLRVWAEDLLDETRLRQDGYFDTEVVRIAWQQHLSGRHNNLMKLWPVLMFQAWLDGTSRNTPAARLAIIPSSTVAD